MRTRVAQCEPEHRWVGLVKGKTLDKIVKEAVRFMVNELEAERAMVLMPESGQELPVAKAVYGFESSDIWDGEVISTGVLKKALKKGQPVMLMDAQQDFEFKSRGSVLASGARSVLCVPIKDEEDEVVGLLYADDRMEKARFDYGTRDRLVRFGEDFNQAYLQIRKAESQAQLTTAVVGYTSRNGSWWKMFGTALVVLSLMVATGVALFQAGMDETSPSPTAGTTFRPEELRAFTLVFLGKLKSGTFPRELVTQRFERELSESDLEGWMSQHRDPLSAASVVATRLIGVEGVATIRLAIDGREVQWEWKIAFEDESWKMDSLGGNPLP